MVEVLEVLVVLVVLLLLLLVLVVVLPAATLRRRHLCCGCRVSCSAFARRTLA